MSASNRFTGKVPYPTDLALRSLSVAQWIPEQAASFEPAVPAPAPGPGSKIQPAGYECGRSPPLTPDPECMRTQTPPRPTPVPVNPPRRYQVMRKTWDDGFRDRRSMIQGWMRPGVVILMDPLCNHSTGLHPMSKRLPGSSTSCRSVSLKPFVVLILPVTAWIDIDQYGSILRSHSSSKPVFDLLPLYRWKPTE